MHAKPDLRVFLKWKIARSGSVITDVIRLRDTFNYFSAQSCHTYQYCELLTNTDLTNLLEREIESI